MHSVLPGAWCTLAFALPSFSSAKCSCCIPAPDSNRQQLWRMRHFSSLLPKHVKTKRDQTQAHPLLFLQQLKSETCPGTSSQPLVNEILPNTLQKLCRQALLPSPLGRESRDLFLSSKGARDMTGKVQRSPFHQGICYARQAEIFRLLSTSVFQGYMQIKR